MASTSSSAAVGTAVDYLIPSSNLATAAEGADDPAAALSQGNDTTDSGIPMSPGSLTRSHLLGRGGGQDGPQCL